MEGHPSSSTAGRGKRGPVATVLRNLGRAVIRNPMAVGLAATLVAAAHRLVARTNPLVAGSDDLSAVVAANQPVILALWHGQHLMTHVLWPRGLPLAALVSRSADAEINARIIERFGVETIRGSGGRDDRQQLRRGGAKALIQLTRALASGRSIVMIADISHSKERVAGEGVVTLARLSGRPILPVAYTTSRRFIVKRSWDKSVINLPFGKGAFAHGPLIHVGTGSDMEAARAEVTAALDEATRRAAGLLGREPDAGR